MVPYGKHCWEAPSMILRQSIPSMNLGSSASSLEGDGSCCSQLPWSWLYCWRLISKCQSCTIVVMHNFKCFLWLMSLLARLLIAKMFLFFTSPLLFGHLRLQFPSIFSRIQRELETVFGCNTGLFKARKIHCHFTESFWLYFSYCLNVAVMCVYASVSLHRHFVKILKLYFFMTH